MYYIIQIILWSHGYWSTGKHIAINGEMYEGCINTDDRNTNNTLDLEFFSELDKLLEEYISPKSVIVATEIKRVTRQMCHAHGYIQKNEWEFSKQI
jgi:hypothetical protein